MNQLLNQSDLLSASVVEAKPQEENLAARAASPPSSRLLTIETPLGPVGGNGCGGGPRGDSTPTHCENCGQPFAPRAGSGGKRQKFCTPECRQAFHSQRDQRGSLNVGLAVSPAEEEEPKLLDQAVQSSGQDNDTRDFDWKIDCDDVCIEEQLRIAIYINTLGSIVIRQRANPYDGDDPCICIRPDCLLGLIAALKRYLP